MRYPARTNDPRRALPTWIARNVMRPSLFSVCGRNSWSLLRRWRRPCPRQPLPDHPYTTARTRRSGSSAYRSSPTLADRRAPPHPATPTIATPAHRACLSPPPPRVALDEAAPCVDPRRAPQERTAQPSGTSSAGGEARAASARSGTGTALRWSVGQGAVALLTSKRGVGSYDVRPDLPLDVRCSSRADK